MLARGGGNIILIGSSAGTSGGAGVAAYSASKSFVTTLAEGLWYELAPKNVRVLGLVLGAHPHAGDGARRVPAGWRGYTADDPDVVAARPVSSRSATVRSTSCRACNRTSEAAAKLTRAERVKAMSEATLALQSPAESRRTS